MQGLNKDDARKEFGEEQVHIWRRSYDVKPPAETEEQREAYLADRRYNHLDKRMMPYSESLKDTFSSSDTILDRSYFTIFARWSNGISFCTRKFNSSID